MKIIVIFLTCLTYSFFPIELDMQENKNENLYGTWYRSFEEDGENFLVYRPREFKFPPARVREKIEILEDGVLFEHRITPSDAYAKVKGKYYYCLQHRELTFTFSENGVESSRIYEVLESTKQILRLKQKK